MLGDEAQPAESDGEGRARSGPRHAAPRKSLLTRLHMPAGKAVALAAMPTAVLMGMGFTPHLAQADELPKSPFKPGPCVTQPDTPTPSATDKADGGDTGKTAGKSQDKPKPDPSTSPTSTPKPSSSPAAPEPTTSPSPADTGKPATEAQPDTKPSASPSPSTTKATNPLDPLGLGDLLGGLLGVGGSSSSASSAADTAPTTQAPSPDPTTTTAPPAADPVKSTADSVGKTVKDTTDAVKDTVKGTADAAGDAAKDTVKGVTGGVKKATKGVKDAATPPAGTDGQQSYPCPTTDAQALADAQAEQGIPLLPDDPWILKSSLLTLYGLEYHGIVEVKTYSGHIKKVLKFTASGVDIGDLHQIQNGAGGTKTHVTARPGSTSTIRNGTVTMYTESLSGNLLGAVPITFTPEFPPPLTVPVLFFTNVTVIQAGQFGGDLTVPGMKVLPGQKS